MITHGHSPRWIPVLSGVGIDYAVIDTEHNPRGRAELGDYLAMFNTSGVVPIVRIPIPDSHYVTMAMDAGAQGVLARTVRRSTRYRKWWRRPNGVR